MSTTLKTDDKQAKAHARARYLIGLMWHAGAYLIIGTLLIVLDLLGPGWLNWSFWILGFWGLGLAFHVLSYLIAGRKMEQRLAEEFAAEEQRGSDQSGSSGAGVSRL